MAAGTIRAVRPPWALLESVFRASNSALLLLLTGEGKAGLQAAALDRSVVEAMRLAGCA